MTSMETLSTESAFAGLPPRPKVAFDPIKVYAFETRTGRVAAVVPHVGIPSWNFGVNDEGAWRVQVTLDKNLIDKDLLSGFAEPWRFSFAICQGSYIWQAGPVLGESYVSGSTTSFSGAGLWTLFSKKRILADPLRASAALIAAPDADVAFGPYAVDPVSGAVVPADRQNLSLHTIAKRLVQLGAGAVGGNLPIVYPDDIAGTAIRTYPGYDMAYVGQRLFELTQVISGPEVELRPEFVDPVTKQAIQWRMRIGNDKLGRLNFPHAWDLGKGLISLPYDTDGTDRNTRDYERGNGMNRDLITGYFDQPVGSDPAALLLENVGGDHTSAADTDTLNAWAQSQVMTGAVTQPSFVAVVRVPGDDGQGNKTGSPNLTEVAAGDNAFAQIRGHARLPDGTYGFRVVGVSSGDRAQQAKLRLDYLGRTA